MPLGFVLQKSPCIPLSTTPLPRAPLPPPLQDFLAGANNIDEHFRSVPFENNLPVLLGLYSVWNVSFLGYPTRAILPYCQVCAGCAWRIPQ